MSCRELMSGGPNGTILSTDDYFFQDDTSYVFDGTLLADAHDWNQKRGEKKTIFYPINLKT